MKKKNKNNSKKQSKLQKTGIVLLHIIRLLLAAVFIFSGFVKAIDPLGFTYKIQDYLTAFGGAFANLSSLALPVAIGLSAFELMLGLCLLFQVRLRLTSIFVLLFMLVMTPLTLYIAIKNPVTDCGCFGDAIVITNWQTFFKNIVFLIFTIIIIFFNKNIKPLFLPHIEWIAVLLFFGVGIGLSEYCLNHLPLIDFLPYKAGINIPESMYVPENAKKDESNTTFIYEKNGVQKEFTLENYPKGDSTWKFVDQKTVLISKGYEAPIHNFSIVDENFDDITENVIYYEGETYLLIMYDLNKASEDGAKKAEEIYLKYKNTATKFYALTSSSDEDVQAFRKKTGVTYPFCKTDPITLKTIVRANPGLMLIKNKVIQQKWHWKDF